MNDKIEEKKGNNHFTSIGVTVDVWQQLHNMKSPGVSMNDVIKQLLKEHEENKEHEQAKKDDKETEECGGK